MVFLIFLKILMIILSITIILCLYRAVTGPTTADRVISVNIIGTKITVLMAYVGAVFKEPFFFDLAMVYVLLLFVATLAFVKYLEVRSLDR